jgi:WD40 repeat protein
MLAIIAILTVVLLILALQMRYTPRKVESGLVKAGRVFTEHRAGVWAVKFSPDGQRVASAGIDSAVIVRDRSTGQIIYRFQHPESLTNLDYSNNGVYVASSSYDGCLRIWNLNTGKLSREIKASKATVWTLAFSPDGKKLASAGDDKIIRIWDVETGSLLRELKGHTMNVWNVQFSPDGKRLASGSFDTLVKIWEVESGKLLSDLPGHTEAVVALAFNAAGDMLASTSDDKTIRLWDPVSMRLLKILSEGDEHVQAAAFSPDGKMLVSGGRDKSNFGELIQNFFGDSDIDKGVSMRLWDVATGTVIQTFSKNANDVNDVAWSRDGRYIASASADQTVRLWKMQ